MIKFSSKHTSSMWIIAIITIVLVFVVGFAGLGLVTKKSMGHAALAPVEENPPVLIEASPSAVPSPTPSPTPRPPTFAELNEQYGPCLSLPVLMYHHIQSEEQAKTRNQVGLTVYTPTFREHMQYLKDKGYTTLTPKDLSDFFDSGSRPPSPAVLITVDDGYDDNYTDMWPVLKEFGYTATVFLATGLMENPGYMSWNQAKEMASGGIYFGNHTWSHQNMKAAAGVIEKEVGTAEVQLSDRGFDSHKVFAFPYGLESGQADEYLTKEGYSLAFTTVPGRIQCAQQKYSLPRIRVGNSKLSVYGL